MEIFVSVRAYIRLSWAWVSVTGRLLLKLLLENKRIKCNKTKKISNVIILSTMELKDLLQC